MVVKKKKPPEDIIIDSINIEPIKKPDYKCFYYFNYHEMNNKIFYELSKISKNIYNSTLYSINIFNIFKIKLYSKLYNDLKNNNKIDCDGFIKNQLIEYHDLYSKLNDKIKNNNNYIYQYIILYLKQNNILIKTSTYKYYLDFFISSLKNDINLYIDNNHIDLLYEDIIKNIINSIYIKNINLIKNQMLEHKKYSFIDEEIISDIKNNNIIDVYPKNVYKIKIKEDFNIELKSDQNYICRLTYSKLSDNTTKLDTTMIGMIMTKAYQAYSSYYALLEKGIKCNRPKYIEKNGNYNLIYTFSKAVKIDNNNVNVYTSNNISKNFDNIFGDKYIKLSNNKYIEKKYLKLIDNNKIYKKYNYIINNQYINKDNKNIIDSRYVKIYIPNKIKDYNIKTIDISYINNYTKISFNYETGNINNNKKNNIKINESISIDLGMKNLMTIYDPTGTQKIIDGKYISSINTYYNKLISESQSKKNKNLQDKYQLKRKNIINNYFNIIVKWISKKYVDKKLIIIGYNKEWKQNTNMGKENNHKFNKIPYITLINKLKTKIIEMNKNIILTEESYTSKCDAISLEEIKYHEQYQGKRIKRGLYMSGNGKLINADLNGAINIMRKVFRDMKEIKGEKIYNVERVKIFREVL